MKLSFIYFLYSALLASTSLAPGVCASPGVAEVRNNANANSTASTQLSPVKGRSVGAAYLITNEPSGNFVVAADIGTDGQLNLRRAINAGGIGAHGINPGGGDPLFSQGSIKASSAGNIVATVNAGSNTISVFSIDPSDPTNLKIIGKPAYSGGQFPMSVDINKAGDTVCALNGGAVNGVSCFRVHKQQGLVPIANTVRSLNLNQTTPPTGPPGATSNIIFSEDNKRLIASIKGFPSQPGFFAVWDIAPDGSLSKEFQSVAPANGGHNPFGMTIIKGKNAVLAADTGIGYDIFDLSSLRSGSKTNKSSAVAIDGQAAICWSTFSEKTGNFYLIDAGKNIITEVHVDNNIKGSIVKQYQQANGSGTIDSDVASVGNTDYLYVLSQASTSIDVLSLDGPGNAKNIETVDLAGPAKSAGVTINPLNLQGMATYVRN